MYIPLILFIASLLSIIVMIGRKWLKLEEGQVLSAESIPAELPYLQEVREVTVKNIRKHGYNTLVTTIRIYVKTTDFLKNEWSNFKRKTQEFGSKLMHNTEKKEISKFLSTIGEYKQKIRDIKHRIRKEENL